MTPSLTILSSTNRDVQAVVNARGRAREAIQLMDQRVISTSAGAAWEHIILQGRALRHARHAIGDTDRIVGV